jgi:hypothetical protein
MGRVLFSLRDDQTRPHKTSALRLIHLFGDGMNKWQIICPLAAMAIAAVVALALIRTSINRDTMRHQVYQIGRELVAATNSSAVVRLGPGLEARMAELLGSPSGVAAVKWGDEPSPIGDGQATSRLFLTNASGTRLGIRLRRDSTGNKFHVLGFWNVAEPGGAALNGSRPIRSETNQTSSAAGSRR